MSKALVAHLGGQPSDPVTLRQSIPSPNPRRIPAHRSVSLKHSPIQHHCNSGSSPGKKPSSSAQPILAVQKSSSGENSNAERWFENSNNNVCGNCASFVDSDSPFYPRGSSGDSPPDRQVNLPHKIDGSLPRQHDQPSGVLSAESSSDGFRSVIDDLTIKNKKLRQKLKKYSRSRGSQLDADRLFEVRVHGLSSRKKRELDELLKQFTLNLDDSPSGSSENSPLQYIPYSPPIKNTSSQSSIRFADSGYGSVAASGQIHNPGSASSNPSLSRKYQKEQSLAIPAQLPIGTVQRNQNIHSYLHDIPPGQLPKHPRAMTEKSKKKLVVRRLEQIFAGREASTGGHQLPIQQQEISQSAARADRSTSEAQGNRVSLEGIREAPIMDHETEDPMDLSKLDDGPDILVGGTTDLRNSGAEVGDNHLATGEAVEQRPTRPLDLDPYRAQVPAENMKYFRHLGFSVSDTSTEGKNSGQSWIYLNLLINMAQLHTINVTTEFVRKALTEYSTKLELSNDHRKVRWKCGQKISPFNSGRSSEIELESRSSRDSHEGDKLRSRKRTKLSHNDAQTSLSDSGEGAESTVLNTPDHGNKLSYTPLFFRGDKDDDSEDNSSDESDPSASSFLPDENTGFSSSLKRSNSDSKRATDGPIVFYNKAKFCSDLSGDSHHSPGSPQRPMAYSVFTTSAIGTSSPTRVAPRMFSSLKDSPLYQTKQSQVDMDIDEDYAPSLAGLSISSAGSSKKVQFAEPDPDIEFEVSGIGGIQPADNFTITVVCQHKSHKSSSASGKKQSRIESAPHGSRLTDILNFKPSSGAISQARIVSTQVCSLPPSALPPPSYAMLDESDSDSDDSDAEASIIGYNGSNLTSSVQHLPPPLVSTSPQASSIQSQDDDIDDDSSVDMLATARQLQPETILAQEREYDAGMAERLAEEIPAGSSAATIGGGGGGGSGFESPNMDMVSDDGVGEEASDDEEMRSVSS